MTWRTLSTTRGLVASHVLHDGDPCSSEDACKLTRVDTYPAKEMSAGEHAPRFADERGMPRCRPAENGEHDLLFQGVQVRSVQ